MMLKGRHFNARYLGLAVQSAGRLASLVQPDGRFVYKRDAISGLPKAGYNIVRHSGCVWAINLVAKEVELGREANEAARRAMNWLASNKIISRGDRKLCVADKGVIKLGANALAVLALLSLSDFSSNERELVVGICEYIRSQRARNDFVHKRSLVGNPHKFRSEYYTGQALFALLVASESLPDIDCFTWSRVALKDLLLSGYGLAEQSHWMMYAVEACQRVAPEEMLVDYAVRMADGIVRRPFYRRQQRCTPIACRTESLLCCLRILSSAPNTERLRSQIGIAIDHNLRLQLRNYLPGGDFIRDTNSDEIRIDYLQHNLLSLFFRSQLFSSTTP
jgi:hypothetical protein